MFNLATTGQPSQLLIDGKLVLDKQENCDDLHNKASATASKRASETTQNADAERAVRAADSAEGSAEAALEKVTRSDEGVSQDLGQAGAPSSSQRISELLHVADADNKALLDALTHGRSTVSPGVTTEVAGQVVLQSGFRHIRVLYGTRTNEASTIQVDYQTPCQEMQQIPKAALTREIAEGSSTLHLFFFNAALHNPALS